MTVFVKDLDKSELLCALFANATVNGYCIEDRNSARTVEEAGFVRDADLSPEEARQYLQRFNFDITGRDIRGRWLEVNLQGDHVDLAQYDEHFGCCGSKIVDRLRMTGQYTKLEE